MLHDRLVTFRAKCPDEILDLTLYRYLEKEGILVELDTSLIDRNELTIQYMNPIVGKKATHEELKKLLGENYSFSEYIKDDKFVPDGNYEINSAQSPSPFDVAVNPNSNVVYVSNSDDDTMSMYRDDLNQPIF